MQGLQDSGRQNHIDIADADHYSKRLGSSYRLRMPIETIHPQTTVLCVCLYHRSYSSIRLIFIFLLNSPPLPPRSFGKFCCLSFFLFLLLLFLFLLLLFLFLFVMFLFLFLMFLLFMLNGFEICWQWAERNTQSGTDPAIYILLYRSTFILLSVNGMLGLFVFSMFSDL